MNLLSTCLDSSINVRIARISKGDNCRKCLTISSIPRNGSTWLATEKSNIMSTAVFKFIALV